DGIRDDLVTGVQTCALPIFLDIAVVVRNQDLGHRTSSDAPTHTPNGHLDCRGLTWLLEHWGWNASTQTGQRCVGREHVRMDAKEIGRASCRERVQGAGEGEE